MFRGSRWLLPAAAWAALLGFGWLSWQAYSSRRDPEGYRGSWRIGPPVDALNDAADRRLASAMAAMEEPARPIGERMADYERELGAADALLVRSLRLRPAQARSLALLAATRWELAATRPDPAAAEPLAMIEVASRMAPAVPRVQFDLGKLLLEIGQTDAAADAFGRTLELDPGRSADVVELLRRRGHGGDDILSLLPAGADLLAAVAPAFAAEGRTDAYRVRLEREMDPDHPGCLAAYGAASLAGGHAGALIERLVSMGKRASDEAEAERLQQLSLAYLAQSRPADALASARRARALFPGSGAGAERLGDLALEAGDPAAARAAYRDALALWARVPGKPERRARLYRQIGRTYEAEGRGDLAYDAFKMASRLDEDDRYTRRRIAEMEAAAGIDARAGGQGR